MNLRFKTALLIISTVLLTSLGSANLEGMQIVRFDAWDEFNNEIECDTDVTDRCVEGDDINVDNDFSFGASVSSGDTGFCGTGGIEREITLPDTDSNLGFVVSPDNLFIDYFADSAGIRIENESGESEWLVEFTSEGEEKLNESYGGIIMTNDDAYASLNKYKGETVTLKLMIQGKNGSYCNLQDRQQSIGIKSLAIVSGLKNPRFEDNEQSTGVEGLYTSDKHWTNLEGGLFRMGESDMEVNKIQHDELEVSTGMDDDGAYCGEHGRNQYVYVPKGETVELVFEASATLDEDAGRTGLFTSDGPIYTFEAEDLGSSYDMKERRVDVSEYSGQMIDLQIGIKNDKSPPCDPIAEVLSNLQRDVNYLAEEVSVAREESESEVNEHRIEFTLTATEELTQKVTDSSILSDSDAENMTTELEKINQSVNDINNSRDNPSQESMDQINNSYHDLMSRYEEVERPSEEDMDSRITVQSVEFDTSGSEDESNQPPTAGIEASLFAERTVTVDASSSTDPDDGIGDLETRWDWTNDGTWNTEWNSSRAAEHSYSEDVGNEVTLKGQVRDTSGATDSAVATVTFGDSGGGGDEEGVKFKGDLWGSVKVGSTVKGSDIPGACGSSPTAYGTDDEGLAFRSLAANNDSIAPGTWLFKMDSQCTVDLPTTNEGDTGNLETTDGWASANINGTLNGSDIPEACGTSPTAYNASDGSLGFHSLAGDGDQIGNDAYLISVDGSCDIPLPDTDGESDDSEEGDTSVQQQWCSDNGNGNALRDECVTESQALAEGGIYYEKEDASKIQETCSGEKGFVCEK